MAFVSSALAARSVGSSSSGVRFRGVGVVVPRGSSTRSCVCQMTASGGGGGESSAGSIDFSDVNLQGAGKDFEGMVFMPEGDAPIEVPSRARMMYTETCESAINNQINVEYTASYAYHALFAYFDRDTVSLPGFAKYFQDQSAEEKEHAELLMKYQNRRGGRVMFKPLAVPEMKFDHLDGTSDAMYAMDLHLQLEKFVYKKLLEVHTVADSDSDPEMCNFIEDMLSEQVEAVKKAAEYVAQLRRVGTGHGVWHFDKELAEA